MLAICWYVVTAVFRANGSQVLDLNHGNTSATNITGKHSALSLGLN
jgi:hypothetical protein